VIPLSLIRLELQVPAFAPVLLLGVETQDEEKTLQESR